MVQTALLQKVTISKTVGKVSPPGPPVGRAAEILQSPSSLRVGDVPCSVDRASPLAILILLFPSGLDLEDKPGGDRRVCMERIPRRGRYLAPRFGAPRCSFSFGTIDV